MSWKRIADRTIKKSTHQDDVLFQDGDTLDIVSVILHADSLSGEFTERFAPSLRGITDKETTRNVWDFVKTNIRYQRDRTGHERIKSPGKLWADKVGDCKSMSVFVGSIFKNLGIPYLYRFAHYPNPNRPNDKDVNHVFVVATIGGKEIAVDPVANRWNYEEPYEHAFDHEIIPASASSNISGFFSIGSLQQYALPATLGFIAGIIAANLFRQ